MSDRPDHSSPPSGIRELHRAGGGFAVMRVAQQRGEQPKEPLLIVDMKFWRLDSE